MALYAARAFLLGWWFVLGSDFYFMQCYRVTALRPIEISATFAGADSALIVKLESGQERGGVQLVHRVIELGGSARLDIIPHPEAVGVTVVLGELLEIERVPNSLV